MGRYGSKEQDYPWDDTVDKPFIIDLLKRGFSRAQIVAEMPVRDGIRPTRNAMIGKISRWELNGLKPRKPADPSKRPHRAKTTKAPSAPKTIEAPATKPKAAPAPPPPILLVKPSEDREPNIEGEGFQLSAGGKAVLSLQFHECKWPIGDPADANFGFCGHGMRYGPRLGQLFADAVATGQTPAQLAPSCPAGNATRPSSSGCPSR